MMRLDSSSSEDSIGDDLVNGARATWGKESLADLRPTIAVTANAIWRVLQEQLEPTDAEPWGR